MVNEVVKLINALSQTNQILSILINDPQVPADQKKLIEDRLSINRRIILESSTEREVNHV